MPTISRLKLLKSSFLGLVIASLGGLPRSADAQSGAGIHYQGRLTSPEGTPVADGTYDVTFTLFDDPTAGVARWTETVPISAHGGEFSTILGRTTPFATGLFSRQLWLQVSISGRALLPRQELGASPYAMYALGMSTSSIVTTMIADKAVTTEKIADGAVTEAKLAPGMVVPVGSVISWWGDSQNTPDGWVLCDGRILKDPKSPLDNLVLPDLRNQFVRGAVGNVRSALPMGGANEHKLTVSEMPAHSHEIDDPGHQHDTITCGWGEGPGNGGRPRMDGNSPLNDWNLWSEKSPTGIKVKNAGDGAAFPTVPAYVGLVYIMRVR